MGDSASQRKLRLLSADETTAVLEPAESPYHPGDIIAAKYELVSVIGQGGMGSVWLARNLVLYVDVALKLINRDVASEEASERLLVEARAAARLGHPSIVRVHDFGETHRGDPFIVMELLNGESLADVIERKGRLSPIAAVRMLLPVLGALAEAHEQGIVHRDLKPDNIILVSEQSGTLVPKLVDFGIAKLKRETSARPPPSRASPTAERARAGQLTQLGQIVGSPDYVSPEQARAEEVDERSDLWSLSVVLYEAIVGDRPFRAATLEKQLLSILLESPAPITALDAGDAALWQIVSRGLEKAKHARWQRARDMGKALAGWLLAQGIDTDICGASVRQHWLEEGSPTLSERPGPGVREAPLVDRDPLGVRATPMTVPQVALPGLGDGSAQREELAAMRGRWLVPGVVMGSLVALASAAAVAALSLRREPAPAAASRVDELATSSTAEVAATASPLPDSLSIASSRPHAATPTAPATAPTTAPTTAPATAPTTPPATAPATAPTTAPTTAPATAPTTAPTTPPATAPTTPPTTAASRTAPRSSEPRPTGPSPAHSLPIPDVPNF